VTDRQTDGRTPGDTMVKLIIERCRIPEIINKKAAVADKPRDAFVQMQWRA